MHHLFVTVSDSQGKPLMPTAPARARRWITSGQATAFWKGGLFGVRLNVEPASHVVQPIAVGIDPESLREGYSVLCRLFPVSVFVVEDIKAATRGKKRWDQQFSPLEVGKHWFYAELGKLAPVVTRQGYETKASREQLGLKKTGKKLAEVWEAHCVDSWVLARGAVGGATAPDNTRLVCMAPFAWHHRQLHRFQPEKGGKRKPYGGTLITRLRWRTRLVPHTGSRFPCPTQGAPASSHG